jgi:hypothetical protein
MAKTPITFYYLRGRTMISLGGAIYYQAVLTKPHSEVILTVISHSIEQRNQWLLIFGGYLIFLI